MRQLLLFAFFFHCVAALAQKGSYYVDNIKGNDANNGKTPASAWKTITRLNALRLTPGDKIFLKRGQSFEGNLTLKGSGTADLPLQLRAYGRGHRPIIRAGRHDFGLQLMDAAYWEISDMEVTGSNMAGIFIGCTKDNMVLDHIRITNCYVHDIGDTTKLDWNLSKSTGGIIVVNGSIDQNKKPVFYNSVFNDVVIDNCTVRYIHRWNCFSISSGKINGQGAMQIISATVSQNFRPPMPSG